MIEITKLESRIDGGIRIYPVQKSTGKYLGTDALGYANVKAANHYLTTPSWDTMCKEVHGTVFSRDKLKEQYNGDWTKVYDFERKVRNDWKKTCVEYREKQVTILLDDKK